MKKLLLSVESTTTKIIIHFPLAVVWTSTYYTLMISDILNNLSNARVLVLRVDLRCSEECLLTAKRTFSDPAQKTLFVDYVDGINGLSQILSTPGNKVWDIYIDTLSCELEHRIANENLASAILQNTHEPNLSITVDGQECSPLEFVGRLLFTFTLT